MRSLPFYPERKMIYRQRAIRSIRWSTCFMNESSSWRVGFVKEKGMCVGIAVRSEITKVFFNKTLWKYIFHIHFTRCHKITIINSRDFCLGSAWSADLSYQKTLVGPRQAFICQHYQFHSQNWVQLFDTVRRWW